MRARWKRCMGSLLTDENLIASGVPRARCGRTADFTVRPLDTPATGGTVTTAQLSTEPLHTLVRHRARLAHRAGHDLAHAVQTDLPVGAERAGHAAARCRPAVVAAAHSAVAAGRAAVAGAARVAHP